MYRPIHPVILPCTHSVNITSYIFLSILLLLLLLDSYCRMSTVEALGTQRRIRYSPNPGGSWSGEREKVPLSRGLSLSRQHSSYSVPSDDTNS